ncbi:hypothetical protein BGX27_009407 [Mortierella sp. AM989]|nr:hypothetical protein BGX27_009407 [Mortierella sp. AM989]
MSEADLNLPTIVPLLQPKSGNAPKSNANPRQQAASTTQSDAFIAQHPHLVPSSLKVETVLLTKELSKFRACDQNTCFYCREWAQWIFKKTFGKDKSNSTTDKKGGRLGGNVDTGPEPKKKHKEYAMVVCERFYQRSTSDGTPSNANGRQSGAGGAGSVAAAAIAASKAGTGTAPAPPTSASGNEGFVSEIIETVREWMKQPSALYTSPEVFSLIDFESLYSLCPLQNQEQNTQQDDVTPILATVNIEKAHMVLGHQGYPLLKRVTKAQLQNQIMSPTCQHTKGNSKTPADLELEKELFNEDLTRMRTRDQEGLRKQIGPVWRHVEEALDRMEGAEKVRSGILASSRAKEFAQAYKDRLLSFQEIWSNIEGSVKKPASKKKGLSSESSPADPVGEVDQGFQLFIDNMQYIHKQLTSDVLESSERSLREFIKELAAAQTKILKLALARIQDGKVGAARIDKILEESPEKCRNALKMVEQLNPIFDTKMAQFRVLVLNKLKEVDEEVEAVAAAYFQDSQKTAQGRLEKAANKDFRRRIKKLEFLSLETRKWFFQSRLTLFSSLDFATVCLNTLGILMEEAEVLEAVQLGLHDDHFRSRVVKSQEGRMRVALQFREGVKTGRRVLAVMISRLMMREGARAMGEMAAIQKEKKFLKSIGQDVSETKFNSKGYLVPSRDTTPTASAQVSDDEDVEGPPGASTVSKNKKKKDKKKKKAAEAAEAAAVAAATSAADIPEVETATPNLVDDSSTVMSSKESRDLKKQAKKEAKRQAKEAAEAEEAAAALAAAKKEEEARRIREMREAQEAIQRQEARELREKKEAKLAQEKKTAEEAREAEVAKAKKAVEEAARAKKEAEAAALAKKEAEEAAARLRAQEALEAEKAREKEKVRKQKEAQNRKNSIQSAKESTAKISKDTASAVAVVTASSTSQSTKESTASATPKVSSGAIPVTAAITTSSVSTPTPTQVEVTADTKIPTWGPSATTLANRAAQAAKEAERSQSASRKQFSEERSEWTSGAAESGESNSRQTNGTSNWDSSTTSNATSNWDSNTTSNWNSNTTSNWDSKTTSNRDLKDASTWESNTASDWDTATVDHNNQNDDISKGWDRVYMDQSSKWDTSGGWGRDSEPTKSRSEPPKSRFDPPKARPEPSNVRAEAPQARLAPATQVSDREDNGRESAEDLSRLPTQTLVSLVQTLQAENKSLLTTLVSMQHQVSSLTERYSTLATLAREHEQQAIQAMESQKQREMEEIQRYVWKVEEKYRQLEKHVLTTHQHRMQMQQMQHNQQFQQHQQQQTHASGPPGIPSMGNISMPPPGFGNLLGLGRPGSAPSSPPSAQRSLSGMESPSSSSSIPMSGNGSSSGAFSSSMSFANGSMDSPQLGFMSSPHLSTMPSSGSGAPPPGYDSAPKKTHWRHRGEARCGNCAQLGHASVDCQAGCRYCDQAGHLSQDCPRMSIPLV